MLNISKEDRENLSHFIKKATEDERIVFLHQVMRNWEVAGMEKRDIVLQGHNLALVLAKEINDGSFPETSEIQAASFLLRKACATDKEKLEDIEREIRSKASGLYKE